MGPIFAGGVFTCSAQHSVFCPYQFANITRQLFAIRFRWNYPCAVFDHCRDVIGVSDADTLLNLISFPDNGPPHQPVMCAPNTTWTNPCAECSCSPEGVPGCYLKTCSHLMGTIESNVAGEIKDKTIDPPDGPAQWIQQTTSRHDGSHKTLLDVIHEVFSSIEIMQRLKSPQDLPPKTIPLKKLNHSEAECLPGTFWRSACHSCRCSERAAAECVKIPDCSDQEGEPIRCQPESTFARECNWCRCLESGLVLCTLKECAPFRQGTVYGHKPCGLGVQTAGSRSFAGTDARGLTAAARLTARHPHTRTRAEPDTTERGSKEHCYAKISCLAVEEEVLGVGKQCEVGTGWRSGCSSCRCESSGEAYCTLDACAGRERRVYTQ
ncbi:hypothetical protein EVAR_97667_1 [Eumeta japonica]|uniref:Pacifastin domain-containing protein n=1 Tax=Eumeta variegata TaxID=151549 RepID=A0A4C1X0S6_EUMVA|nr:hypothetical protein EVAR_97667_1 [Eumeta japonica]